MNNPNNFEVQTTYDTKLFEEWGMAQGFDSDIEEYSLVVSRVRNESLQAGEICALLNLASKSKIDELIAVKPDAQRTVEWLGKNLSSVQAVSNKIVAIAQGILWLDQLSMFDLDKGISSDVVLSHCKNLQSAILSSPTGRPIVVFSDISSLTNHRQLGPASRSHDPIIKSIGEDFVYALAPGERIREVWRQLSSTSDSSLNSQAEKNLNYKERSKGGTIQFIVDLLESAYSNKVTDIAIEPLSGGDCIIRYRRYGELFEPTDLVKWSLSDTQSVYRMLLSSSGAATQQTTIYEPKDGQLFYQGKSFEAFLRLSFIPVKSPTLDRQYLSVSIRLLDRSEKHVDATSIGIPSEVLTRLNQITTIEEGQFVVCGPTNSGKSTLLAATIGIDIENSGNTKKRVTLEDPVERRLPRVTHIDVPATLKDVDETPFVVFLKAILRHDPDLVMVGEIRDETTALLSTRLANTGHQVFTTIHANSTFTAFTAIANYVPPNRYFELLNSMNGIISQRILGELCSSCSKIHKPTENEISDYEFKTNLMSESVIELPKTVKVRDAKGCRECSRGIKGYIPVHSILIFTEEVKNILSKRDLEASDARKLKDLQDVTMYKMCMKLVEEGRIEVGSVRYG